MKQYILKSDIVAEIEKLQLCTMDEHMNFYSAEAQGEYNALSKLDSFLDTLEVKEVDLEKELVCYHNENFSPCNDGTLLSCETGAELAWCDYECIAKHFYELGLKAKGE